MKVRFEDYRNIKSFEARNNIAIHFGTNQNNLKTKPKKVLKPNH